MVNERAARNRNHGRVFATGKVSVKKRLYYLKHDGPQRARGKHGQHLPGRCTTHLCHLQLDAVAASDAVTSANVTLTSTSKYKHQGQRGCAGSLYTMTAE